MTPAARAQAAIECLDHWRDGSSAERALTAWARGARYAGSKDRRAVRDMVYDVLRQKGVCAALGGGETGRALMLGLIRLAGGDPAAIFNGDTYAPEALTEGEKALVAASPEIDRTLDVPDWLHDPLKSALGQDFEIFCEAMSQRAPVFLRVNQAKTSRENAITALAAQDIIAVPDPRCETALEATEGARRVASSDAYQNGLVELQDLSVQMACQSVDWGQGTVLDYCAGGGGKALAIAARTGGPVDVHDAHPKRMADLPARAARAGADLRPVSVPDRMYDIVLTDVPCSGSGTWRRDPEAKWRLTPDSLAALTKLQSGILEDAAQCVVPGGRLVYMTCSLLEAENSSQIAGFLKRQSGWELIREMQLTPQDASDGFFLAELRRGLDV